MSRWTGQARERLQQAALHLYAEQGYARTSVAAVAERAGLTERTYFRHFPDKREVLFADDDRLLSVLLDAVQLTLPTAGAWEAAMTALRALCAELTPRRAELVVRAGVLAQDPGLVERDSAKQRQWVEHLGGALEAKGFCGQDAALAAEAAGAVFRVAYSAWLGDEGHAGLVGRVDDAAERLRSVLRQP